MQRPPNWIIAASLLGVLILWIGRYIDSFWAGISFFAFIAITVFLRQLPVAKTFATLLWGGWFALFVGIPFFLDAFFQTRPFLRQAAQQLTTMTDLQSSEYSRVHGLASLLEFRRWADQREATVGRWLIQQYDALIVAVRRGDRTFPDPDNPARRISIIEADQKLQNKITYNILQRQEHSDFLKRSGYLKSESGFFSGAIDSIKQSFNGKISDVQIILFTLGILGLTLGAVLTRLKVPGTGIFSWIGSILVVLAIIAFILQFVPERTLRTSRRSQPRYQLNVAGAMQRQETRQPAVATTPQTPTNIAQPQQTSRTIFLQSGEINREALWMPSDSEWSLSANYPFDLIANGVTYRYQQIGWRANRDTWLVVQGLYNGTQIQTTRIR